MRWQLAQLSPSVTLQLMASTLAALAQAMAPLCNLSAHLSQPSFKTVAIILLYLANCMYSLLSADSLNVSLLPTLLLAEPSHNLTSL